MSINERVNTEMCYIYIMEYYSAFKNKGTTNFAGKLIEYIILVGLTLTQKDINGMYSLISGY